MNSAPTSPDPAAPTPLQLILVTGLSGSGKSVVLALLEDAGFYTVDNLPVPLLPSLIGLLKAEGHQRVAVAADTRLGSDLAMLEGLLTALRAEGHSVTVLFLTARIDALLQRYSETRRRHPLSLTSRKDTEGSRESKSLLECIEEEQEILSAIEPLGIRLDTSELKPAELRAWVRELTGLRSDGLALLFQSFAFKEGIPIDADLVFDVRCLPNPHYVEALKPQTGKDTAVAAYLRDQPAAVAMIADIGRFLDQWLPQYVAEQRSTLSVAIGCTGGQHRSVYCVESLADQFRGQWPVAVRHRSLLRRGLD